MFNWLRKLVGVPELHARINVLDDQLKVLVANSNRKKKPSCTNFLVPKLDAECIEYVVHNNGLHVVITYYGIEVADYWPTTDKYRLRSERVTKKGIDNLIDNLKRSKKNVQ